MPPSNVPAACHICRAYDLVDASCAIHDLFHLGSGLDVIGGRIELTPKPIGRPIEIIQSVFQVIFRLLRLILTDLRIGGVCLPAPCGRPVLLCRLCPRTSVVAAGFQVFAEFIYSVFYFADAVRYLRL